VYIAHDVPTGNDVIIKLERIAGKNHTLGNEFRIYRKLDGIAGIPRVRWFGMEAGFNAMVADRLGRSLEDLFVQCHFRFTLKTVLLLAMQLVSEFLI
jgi:hypothetical protein